MDNIIAYLNNTESLKINNIDLFKKEFDETINILLKLFDRNLYNSVTDIQMLIINKFFRKYLPQFYLKNTPYDRFYNYFEHKLIYPVYNKKKKEGGKPIGYGFLVSANNINKELVDKGEFKKRKIIYHENNPEVQSILDNYEFKDLEHKLSYIQFFNKRDIQTLINSIHQVEPWATHIDITNFLDKFGSLMSNLEAILLTFLMSKKLPVGRTKLNEFKEFYFFLKKYKFLRKIPSVLNFERYTLLIMDKLSKISDEYKIPEMVVTIVRKRNPNSNDLKENEIVSIDNLKEFYKYYNVDLVESGKVVFNADKKIKIWYNTYGFSNYINFRIDNNKFYDLQTIKDTLIFPVIIDFRLNSKFILYKPNYLYGLFSHLSKDILENIYVSKKELNNVYKQLEILKAKYKDWGIYLSVIDHRSKYKNIIPFHSFQPNPSFIDFDPKNPHAEEVINLINNIIK